MDTNVFRYFNELAHEKNYSRAARNLFISPQGLSNAVKRLEAQLGVPLVAPSGNGIELTEYGKTFHKHAQELSLGYDDMVREIDDLRRKNSGAIQFVVSIGLFNVFPRDAIEAFNEQRPEGALVETVRTLLDDDCEREILNKTADFGLLNNPIDHSVFASVPIHQDTMFLWMHESDPLASRESITSADFAGKTISLLASREFKTSRGIEQTLTEAPNNCTILHTDEVVETLEVAMREHVYALTVRTHAQAFKNEGYVGIPVRDMTWGFSVAYRNDRILSNQDEAFLEFVQQYRQFLC